MDEQKIPMPLPTGSWVELYEGVDMDSQKGSSASIIFEGTVDQHIPETGLLRFEASPVGLAEFKELLEEAEGYEVFTDYE